jgi:hypothetical protein
LFELLLGHPPEPEPEFKPEPGFGPEPGLGTDPDLGPEAELGPDIERGPDSGRAGLPDDIQAILVKALASAPEERFQSAGDLLHVLNDSLERRSAAAPRTESPPVVPPPAEAPPEEPAAGMPAAEEPAAGIPAPEEPAPEEPAAEATAADETQGQPRTKVSVAAVPAPVESAPQHAEHPPGRDKNKIWLTAAVIGLAMLLTLCCLLAVFALFEINDRLREPVATAQVDTNVRSGPALEYEIIGLLREGEQATVYGVSLDGRWWQIAFDAGRGGVGWVPAAFVTVDETGNIDVIPPPTLTPFPAVFASATMIGILAMVIPFRSH